MMNEYVPHRFESVGVRYQITTTRTGNDLWYRPFMQGNFSGRLIYSGLVDNRNEILFEGLGLNGMDYQGTVVNLKMKS